MIRETNLQVDTLGPPPTAPRVSIIICTRDRAEMLRRALEKLDAVESRHDWEALIADNGSLDHTAQVIAEACARNPRFRSLHVAQPGLGAARNAAWQAARGSIVSLTDDDCYVEPDFVDAVVDAFERYPQAGCIGGRILLYDPTDARITIDERDAEVSFEPYSFLNAGDLHGANFSFRRVALAEAGGFDPEFGAGGRFKSAEDCEAVAAMVWRGWQARFDPAPVVYHHHGRKQQHMKALTCTYDAGRGAFYAKFILRRDTRNTYLRGWWNVAIGVKDRREVARLVRELRGAAGYLVAKRRFGFVLVGAPVALAATVYAFVRIISPWGAVAKLAGAAQTTPLG